MFFGNKEDTPSSSDDDFYETCEGEFNRTGDCRELAEKEGQDVSGLEWCEFREWGNECDHFYFCEAKMKW